jgi:hypothetical protein
MPQNPDPSQNIPLSIVQGATFVQQFTWFGPTGLPNDLTDFTADMQFRSTVQDTGTPIIEVSTGVGGIVLGGITGTITVTISATITATLSDGEQLVWNLFLTSPAGVVYPFAAGPSTVFGSTIK